MIREYVNVKWSDEVQMWFLKLFMRKEVLDVYVYLGREKN